MNNTIRLEEIPRRIVSLVPSQTELLHDLGLENEVVGITKFCIYPDDWFQTKTRVGGTKQLNIDKIRELKPDLIIGNKEENTKEDIELLQQIAPVWMSDIYSLENALEMIGQIGEIVGKKRNASKLVGEIKKQFSELKRSKNNQRVLYFIWKDPYFSVGTNTFIDAMINACGWMNFCRTERYPEWKPDLKNQADFVFLSSEPYPFKTEHQKEAQKIFPESRIVLVDGEMFSWYGSRMKFAPKYFQKLIDDLSNK